MASCPPEVPFASDGGINFPPGYFPWLSEQGYGEAEFTYGHLDSKHIPILQEFLAGPSGVTSADCQGSPISINIGSHLNAYSAMNGAEPTRTFRVSEIGHFPQGDPRLGHSGRSVPPNA